MVSIDLNEVGLACITVLPIIYAVYVGWQIIAQTGSHYESPKLNLSFNYIDFVFCYYFCIYDKEMKTIVGIKLPWHSMDDDYQNKSGIILYKKISKY